MRIVLVDNNESTISLLESEIAQLYPEHHIKSFTDPLMSAKYICNNDVELVFLTANMRPVDGFVLLRVLRANKPSLVIVMLLDSEAHWAEELCEAASGCLTTPVSAKSLECVIKQVLL